MLTPKQLELLELMIEISEYCYCATWYEGNEYRLWRSVVDPFDDHKYGMNIIAIKDIEHMRQLSNEIGGWVMFDDSIALDLGKFVPLDKWQKIYASFVC